MTATTTQIFILLRILRWTVSRPVFRVPGAAASAWFFGHLLFCIMPSVLLLLLWCVFPRSAIFLYSISREYYYCLLHYTRWDNPQYSAYLYIVYYTIHTHMYIIITCYVAIVSFRYIHVNVCVVLLHRILLYCTCV